MCASEPPPSRRKRDGCLPMRDCDWPPSALSRHRDVGVDSHACVFRPASPRASSALSSLWSGLCVGSRQRTSDSDEEAPEDLLPAVPAAEAVAAESAPGSWRLFLQNLSKGQVNMATWTNSLECALIKEITHEEFQEKRWYIEGKDTDYALTVNGVLRYVRRRPDRLASILFGSESKRILAFTECRSKMFEVSLSPGPFYHAFVLLEVEGGSMLCSEKYNHELENCFGEQEVVHAFALKFRPSGDARKIVRQCARTALADDSTAPTVGQLMDWIDGPCAKKYQPYDLFRMNCQHYAADLLGYLASIEDRGVGCSSLSKRRVLRFVRQDGLELSRAPEELRNDAEVVLVAVAHSEDGLALQYASNSLRSDRDFVLKAVQRRGLCLQFSSEDLRNDSEVVFAAVRQDGMALAYASEALRQERHVVLEAVRQNGFAVQHASNSLHADHVIARTALSSAPAAAELLTRIRSVRNICEEDNAETWECNDQRGDAVGSALVVVLHARVTCHRLGNHLLVKGTGPDGEELLILQVTRHSERAFLKREVGKRLGRSDKELQLCRSDGTLLEQGLRLGEAWVALYGGKREVLLTAMRTGLSLQLLSNDLRADREVVLAAVSCDAEALKHAASTLRADREVVQLALQQSSSAWRYVAKDLRSDLGILQALPQPQVKPL